MDVLPTTTQCVFDALIQFKKTHDGTALTLRELAAVAGLQSSNTAYQHLNRLEKAGLIERGAFGRARIIRVTGGRWLPPGETDQ